MLLAGSRRTLAEEFSAAPSTYPQPEQAPVAWLVMQRAVDKFRETHGRFPQLSESSALQVGALAGHCWLRAGLCHRPRRARGTLGMLRLCVLLFVFARCLQGSETDAQLLFYEAQSFLTAHGIEEALWGPTLSIKHAQEM